MFVIKVILLTGIKEDTQKIGFFMKKNIGKHLSIDEVSLSQGELYTIVTNKAAKGRKGALVAIVKGTENGSIRFSGDFNNAKSLLV